MMRAASTPGRPRAMYHRRSRRTMAANHGLDHHAQARDCGLTTVAASASSSGPASWSSSGEASTPTASRGSRWTRTADDIASAPAPPQRGLKRAFVASHDSSAHEHGLEILNPPDPHVHITRPGSTSAWTEYGVKHHLARYREEQVVADRWPRRARPRAHRGGHRSRARRAVRRDRLRRGHALRRTAIGARGRLRDHGALAASSTYASARSRSLGPGPPTWPRH